MIRVLFSEVTFKIGTSYCFLAVIHYCRILVKKNLNNNFFYGELKYFWCALLILFKINSMLQQCYSEGSVILRNRTQCYLPDVKENIIYHEWFKQFMLKFICVNFGNVNFFSNFIIWFISALSTQNIFSFSSLSLFSSCFYHFESISTSLHSICQMKLWSSCFCIFQLNFSYRCSYFSFQRISVFHDRSRLAHQTDEPECDHGETETLNSGMTKQAPSYF